MSLPLQNSFCGFLRVILQFLFLFLVTKKNGLAINSLHYTSSITAYNVLSIVVTGQKHEQRIGARVFTVADLKEEPEGAQAHLILGEKEELTEGRKTGRAIKTKPQPPAPAPYPPPPPSAQGLDPPATDLGKGISLN